MSKKWAVQVATIVIAITVASLVFTVILDEVDTYYDTGREWCEDQGGEFGTDTPVYGSSALVCDLPNDKTVTIQTAKEDGWPNDTADLPEYDPGDSNSPYSYLWNPWSYVFLGGFVVVVAGYLHYLKRGDHD